MLRSKIVLIKITYLISGVLYNLIALVIAAISIKEKTIMKIYMDQLLMNCVCVPALLHSFISKSYSKFLEILLQVLKGQNSIYIL